MGDAQNHGLLEGLPGELQADRQVIRRKAAGERNGRQAGQVEGPRQPQEGGSRLLRDAIDTDLSVNLLDRDGRYRYGG